MSIRPLESDQQIIDRIAGMKPYGSLNDLSTHHGDMPLSDDLRADLTALTAIGCIYAELNIQAALSGDIEGQSEALSGSIRVAMALHRLQPHASLADLAAVSYEVY